MFKKIVISACLALFCNTLSAVETVYTDEVLVWSSIITVSGGAAWASPGKNQYLYPNPLPDYEYYSYQPHTDTLASGEIFFGLQRYFYPNVIGQLGLGVAGVGDAKVYGLVEVNGVPDVYSYAYKVNHARVELKGKLISTAFRFVQPYFSASLGAGFNNAHEYEVVSNFPTLFPAYFFASNTAVAFSYSLGAGLQTMITPSWQVGVGYQFADLGKSYFGPSGTLINRGIGLTHLYTNEVLGSLSYLF